jgi:hypothetical protein
MISPAARNGIWRAIAIVLLLGNGCSDRVESKLVLEIPISIHYDSLRLLRFIDGQPSLVHQWSFEDSQGGEHIADIMLRRGMTEMIRMDAILDTNVVGQGQATFNIGDGATQVQVNLVACQPFPATELWGTCVSPMVGDGDGGPLADAGVGTDADSGANVDTGGLVDANGVDASPNRWTAPACRGIDPDAGTPPLPPPLASTPACDQYCAALDQNCPFIYDSDEVCHMACAQVDWPVQDPSNDTVTCRTNWALSAVPGTNQTSLCERAGLVSRGSCGTPCENYCRAGIKLCPTEFPSDLAFCTALCMEAQGAYEKEFPDRSFLAEQLICKVDYLVMAVGNPTLCQLAGPNDCGTACQPVIFPPE